MREPRVWHSALSVRRQVAGWVAAVVLPLLLPALLRLATDTDQLPLAALLLLAATVLVALIGGLLPALVAAVIGFATLNFFFTRPFGRLTIAEPRNVVTLLVFVAVAAAVASVVDRASRRAEEAVRARAEATTLAALSRSVLTGDDTAQGVVEALRATFGQDAVRLDERTDGTDGTDGDWVTLARTPDTPDTAVAADPHGETTEVSVDDDHRILLSGAPLRPGDQRVLEAFAVQAGLVLEYRRLRGLQDRAAALETAETTSTALLRAVSHDLRTPLATMRASVDGLSASGLDAADRTELIATVGSSTDQLERLIDNLLDLSRLSTGLVHPQLADRSLEEVLPPAVAGQPPGAVSLEVDETVPLVRTDAGLLERVVANVVANAVRVSHGVPVRVLAHVGPAGVEIHVVDRGPGVPAARREQLWEPFQRLDDTTAGGLGLGLAVARGLAEAVGARLEATDTPGGGLTMVLSVPRAIS